jgi:hypothetical protein
MGATNQQIAVGMAGMKKIDICAETGRGIQIGIDAMFARGGGTVVVRKGEYWLEDSIRLRPGVRLVGEEAKLRRGELVWGELALDADIGEIQITPKNPEEWRAGMGVCLWDRKSGWALGPLPVHVNGIADGVLHLDEHLTMERYAADGGRVVNYFPMVLGHRSAGAIVEGFEIDAGVEDPEGILKGMRNAVVYFRHSPNSVLRGLTISNGRGDGIIVSDASTDSLVEDCETFGNDNYGIHPGSHSARCTVRRCHIHHNGSDGLYICWGIKGGEFTDNRIHHNGLIQYRSGISIGHKDTDCLIARNEIFENRKYGICFRRKTEGNGAHRATVRENVIENNGSPEGELVEVKARIEPWESVGCGIHISGVTKDVVIEKNTIRETRSGAERHQKHGIVMRAGVVGTKIEGNVIEGHPGEAVLDEAKQAVAVR